MPRKDGSTLGGRSHDDETEIVKVYVRLCKDDMGKPRENCRELRFRAPEDITQADLLAGGFAIDGNSASKSVAWNGDERSSISDDLRFAQVKLVEWLDARGYEVEFE